MKVYMETGCLRQPPANRCLSLFYLLLSSFYPLVTGVVTGISRHFSDDGCGTIFKTFPVDLIFNRSAAVPGAWQMEDSRRLPPATLRLYGNQALEGICHVSNWLIQQRSVEWSFVTFHFCFTNFHCNEFESQSESIFNRPLFPLKLGLVNKLLSIEILIVTLTILSILFSVSGQS